MVDELAAKIALEKMSLGSGDGGRGEEGDEEMKEG